MKHPITSEEQVLKALDIPNFRHMTKDKVVQFASLLSQMNPEVAMKALEQFPHFAESAKEMVGYYTDIADRILESNSKDSERFYDACVGSIETMRVCLESQELSTEDRTLFTKTMLDFAHLMEQWDARNKKWRIKVLRIVGGVIGLGLLGLGAALGSNSEIRLPDKFVIPSKAARSSETSTGTAKVIACL